MSIKKQERDERPVVYLVSACLMGLLTRYDGQPKGSKQCADFLAGKLWLPVCPEQLGGLATPRPAAEIRGGNGDDVLAGRATVETVAAGLDVTGQFIVGARQVLAIAQAQQPCLICLKSRSPSCGAGEIWGVTASLLRQQGFEILEFD